MKRLTITILIVSAVVTGLATPVQAKMATKNDALKVANNWVSLIIQKRGDWGGSETASVAEIQEFKRGGRTLGYFCRVQPQGHIIISPRKELTPVKAFSATCDLDPDSDKSLTDLLKRCMERTVNQIENRAGPIASARTEDVSSLLEVDSRDTWTQLERAPESFREAVESGMILMNYVEGQILLSSSWRQGDPYNAICPIGDASCPDCCPGNPGGPCTTNGRTVVGCTATAAAQIMRYWAWPPYGQGFNAYFWDGDDSCPENGNPGAGAQILSASFNNAYDWVHMANRYDWDVVDNRWEDENGNPLSQAYLDAVAVLSHEVGVAIIMDYGVCGSGAWLTDTEAAYENYFRYGNCGIMVREGIPAQNWFMLIKIQLNKNQPIQYEVEGHIIVTDGWMELGPTPDQWYYHMNYGWGWEGDCQDGCNTWYQLDLLHLGSYENEGMLIYIYPAVSLNSSIGGAYPKEAFNYRYFNVDATGDNATFAPGQVLQFLPGITATCTGPSGQILFQGTTSNNTWLFSIKEAKSAGVRIHNGGIKLSQNGSIKFHSHLGQ